MTLRTHCHFMFNSTAYTVVCTRLVAATYRGRGT